MSAKTIVFGANGGIGEHLARRLSAAKADLILTARDPDTISDLAGDLGAKAMACDVLSGEDIEAVIDAAGDEIAGLAFCVGSIDLKPLKAVSADDFIDSFRLNALAPALAVKAAAPALAKAGGSVVLFSTVAVQQGFANHSVIASAKGAVEGLMRSLAAELAPKVRVNAIAPSLTDTGIAQSMLSSDQMARAIANLHPLPRLGQADEIASMAAYLMGPDAGWITGQVIGVDGGRSTLRTRG